MKANTWKQDLANWAIPEEILKQAPTPPWIHPVELFQIDPDQELDLTPSSRAALGGLSKEKSVLDIGCGGGKATFELIPEVKIAYGVDHQKVMLEKYQEYAEFKDIKSQTFLGDWPDIENQVPNAEVVLAHHVLYNVAEIENFVDALSEHATRRVVVELPLYHPLTAMNAYWKHFWNIERPTKPTAHEANEIINNLGFKTHFELFQAPAFKEVPLEKMVEFNRIRLCLPATKDLEILEFTKQQKPEVRQLATIWWDID